MTVLFITVAVFVGVAAMVGGVALVLRDRSGSQIEDRLDLLAGKKKKRAKEETVLKQGALDTGKSFIDELVSRFGNPSQFLEQADSPLTLTQFVAVSGGVAVLAFSIPVFAGMSLAVAPIAAVTMAFLPLMWLFLRRKRRLKKFAAQLPDALELIARALRAGHSLGAGMRLVAEEMSDPIGKEFSRAFEEQNLGVPLEDTLRSLTERVPNIDLKFFATAVILQRQTGGDLAEILDKIGRLIRERFQIWGQVQALTGEGRLSGIVLLGLPPFLFLAVYYLNPTYSMMLFEDPMGQQMLFGAIIMQVLGALVIRKIVNIKV